MTGCGLWFSLDQDNTTAQRLMLGSVGAFQTALLVSLIVFIVNPKKRAIGTHLILAAISASSSVVVRDRVQTARKRLARQLRRRP